MPERGPKSIIFIILITFCLLMPAAFTGASAETYLFENSISSDADVEETTVMHIGNLNLDGISNGSRVTYNAPIYEPYSVSGYSQGISGFNLQVSPAPAGHTDRTDTFGNRYREFYWNLDSGVSSMDITATSTFHAKLTGDLTPVTLSDPLGTQVPASEDIQRYLRPTSLVQSGDPAIVSKKNELVSGATTQVEAVGRIVNFVKTQIPATADDQPKDAVSSLNNNRGNCVNRAHLALALLRSAGIPARYVSGYVYDDEIAITYRVPEGTAKRTFNWGQGSHAWIEVYYPQEGIWVAYDPYMSKGFVDNRHVKRSVGMEGNLNSPGTFGYSGILTVQNVNPDASVSMGGMITTRNVNDRNNLQYVATEPVPQGDFLLGRVLSGSKVSSSSIRLSLPQNNVQINAPVLLSASIDPARSDGTVTIKKSTDGAAWDDVSSGTPSTGSYAATYSPDSTGQIFLKALWSGAGSIPGSESSVMTLNVVNSTDGLNLTLSPSPADLTNLTAGNGTIDSSSFNNTTLYLRGRLLDRATELPVSNASIIMGPYMLSTNDTGVFTVPLEGDGELRVEATGYRPWNATITSTGLITIDGRTFNATEIVLVVYVDGIQAGNPTAASPTVIVKNVPGFELLAALTALFLAGWGSGRRR